MAYVPPHLRRLPAKPPGKPSSYQEEFLKGRVVAIYETSMYVATDQVVRKVVWTDKSSPLLSELTGLKYREVCLSGVYSRRGRRRVFKIATRPVVNQILVPEDDAEFSEVLYKAGALLIRRPRDTVTFDGMEVALLRNNNSGSFMDLKCRLRSLVKLQPGDNRYDKTLRELLGWAFGDDPDRQLSRVRMWQDMELHCLHTLTDDPPTLDPAFFGWEIEQFGRHVGTHPELCEELAALAGQEIARRHEAEEVNFTEKWDFPKGMSEFDTLAGGPKESARDEAIVEMGLDHTQLRGDPVCKPLILRHRVTDHCKLRSELFCWMFEGTRDKPPINKSGEFRDSIWYSFGDLLTQLDNENSLYRDVWQSLGVPRQVLRSALHDCRCQLMENLSI